MEQENIPVDPKAMAASWNRHHENILRQWGEQARARLKPTYLQGHCLDELEQLLRAQTARF